MLTKFKATCAAVVTTLAFTAPVHSDPGEVTKYLMNEPATVFDLGLIRLEYFLTSYYPPLGSTLYDSRNDRLTIRKAFDEVSSSDIAEQTCKDWLERVRKIGAVDPLSGMVEPPFENSVYSNFFKHISQRNDDAPEDYLKKFDEIIHLKCNHLLDDGTILSIGAPLLGGSFVISRL
ncbi:MULTISPECIES: hypothetical protein [Halocynthiibacter]|uniref:Uncharacterized protein n=1 Tax=Halocynthiibacter halioticoli TaxID=2986804 RepID=A0AAE3IXY6_9RHOB|nr:MULTISPECIES: hypothetical protein [Halocynthiibacter]MCV6824064.1 hypothetical protein [Halocynthiibacter halioticoli]MCW4057065.1 hypothetical protein [Halocynthiibacter sp. SDUM655004]